MMKKEDYSNNTSDRRRSSDGSQSTVGNTVLEEDQKTVQNTKDARSTIDQEPIEYPAMLEMAPFPVLGSLDEITQTLSRVKSNQTHKSGLGEVTMMEKIDFEKDETDLPFKQTEYEHGDGFKNPGWLTVISCFLVNFFVFGTIFSWGLYQAM